jgi:ABC-type xylose transport system permease subunit
MRKFRTLAAVAALAAVALLVPATAQAGTSSHSTTVSAAPQRGTSWNG